MDNRAIGVFDSGLGGLSALEELERLLPGESLIYFGDSAHMPYGNRSDAEITALTLQIIRFFISRNVKMLVVACGTMSSVAMPVLGKACALPYVEVIAPAAAAAAAATENGRVGILATAATIRSRSYERALLELRPGLEVVSAAAPRLVPLVEEGHLSPDDPVLVEAVEESVAAINASGADTMILGCTHYPLISPAIVNALSGKIRIIDNSREVARSMLKKLGALGLAAGDKDARGSAFYTSGDPDHFTNIASRMLRRDLRGLVQHLSLGTQNGGAEPCSTKGAIGEFAWK
jgi:glutamate racemase